jgi:mRNA interferase RelE/StbE
MGYRVELAPQAIRDLRKLSKRNQVRVGARIDALSADPRPQGVKKLKGAKNLFRIRMGEHRLIYQIQEEVLLVAVLRIGDRKEIYRRLADL